MSGFGASAPPRVQEVVNLAVVNYRDIPGIQIVESLGERLLALALLVGLGREAYRMWLGGRADWATPIVRVMAGFLVLKAIPELGQWLLSLIQLVNNGMAKESQLALFGRSIATALSSTRCDDLAWYDSFRLLFSFRGWLALSSGLLYLLMFLVKMVIVDVLFPLCFCLVVFLGTLSVPLGVFPGMGGFSGWVRNVIEVSLWPIVFQFLVALVASSFPQIIGAMADGNVVVNCSVPETNGAVRASNTFSSDFYAVVQYMAVCSAYVVLTLFTPLLSAVVMRSAPVGMIGGVLAAKAAGLAGGPMMAVGGRLAGLGAKAASQGFSVARRAGQQGMSFVQRAGSEWAKRLDRRR